MLKKLLTVLAVVVASVTLAVPAAQAADSPRCVSKFEYGRVHRGMSVAQVHRIFDIGGKVSRPKGAFTFRTYRGCPRHTFVGVSFHKGNMRTKTASWARH